MSLKRAGSQPRAHLPSVERLMHTGVAIARSDAKQVRRILEEGRTWFSRREYPDALIWQYLAPHYHRASPETRAIAIANILRPPWYGNPAAAIVTYQETVGAGLYRRLIALASPTEPHLFWWDYAWHLCDLGRYVERLRRRQNISLEKAL